MDLRGFIVVGVVTCSASVRAVCGLLIYRYFLKVAAITVTDNENKKAKGSTI